MRPVNGGNALPLPSRPSPIRLDAKFHADFACMEREETDNGTRPQSGRAASTA